jgi:hypothetical protein
MAENRHIFNNLTQVEKIKPKIDNPIIVEDVTYNFSDLIENEWISHFPQYSHRMRSTFVKGAGIVDEHIANINQCLIQLEDELYRVYDKLSDDKKAEVTEFIQSKKYEVANFIQSKTNEVSNYTSQKEQQIAKFIEGKDKEIKNRTDTLDKYTNQLENIVKEREATDTKLGLITLNKIREVSPKVVIEVATYDDLKNDLTGFIEKKPDDMPNIAYNNEDYCKMISSNPNEVMELLKDPKERKNAFNSEPFMKIVAPVIALDIIQNSDIYNDLLDSTFGKENFFNNETIIKQTQGYIFSNPRVLEETLMKPDFMRKISPLFEHRILKLFVEDESIRNNIRYAKELQKYIKQYNQSNVLSLFDKKSFKKDDGPENFNNVLGDNMFGLVTLGAYNEGTNRECVMYTKDHKEIVRGNIQYLNNSNEAYTISNCNAIAFEGYTFKQVNDGYACMVVYELKGV